MIGDSTMPLAHLPRVGKLTHSLSSAAGGLFYSVRDTSNVLEKWPIEQVVFGLRDANFERDWNQWRVHTLFTYSSFGPKSFTMSPALIQDLVRCRLDMLHVHGIWNFASLAAMTWRMRTGRPLVISPHGMLDPGALAFSSHKKRAVAALYERRNLQNASLIHALNVSEAASIRAFGIDTPIAIIPNGLAIPDIEVTRRRSWNPETRRTLLFLARIHPKKGIMELIEAWRIMLDTAPDVAARWCLNLVGWDDGGFLEAARARVVELGLADHITLPGALFGEDKVTAFAESHAFILPSRSEGLPMAILEAWAHGMPVLMTDACNLPRGFEAGAAFRVEVEPQHLAAGLIEHLRRDEAELRSSGMAGRVLVESEYSLDQVCKDYAEMYLWLIDGGPSPRFVHFAETRRTL